MGNFWSTGPAARRLNGVRLRVEFTTEPFDLDEAPAHAVVAREIVTGAQLDAVDVGPFGNTAEGDVDRVLGAVDSLLRRSLEAGATRVSLQVNVIADGGGGAAAPGVSARDGGGRQADGAAGRVGEAT